MIAAVNHSQASRCREFEKTFPWQSDAARAQGNAPGPHAAGRQRDDRGEEGSDSSDMEGLVHQVKRCHLKIQPEAVPDLPVTDWFNQSNQALEQDNMALLSQAMAHLDIDFLSPASLNALGDNYYFGRGCEVDYEMAMLYYKRAAAMNYPEAFFNIAHCYDWGKGTMRDHAQAFQYYKRGADLGHAACRYNCAISYHLGEGVAKDYGKAFEYFLAVANQNDAEACYHVALYYWKNLAQTQDDGSAFHYAERAISLGSAQAMRMKAEWYETGKVLPQDNQKAFLLYAQSARAGDSHALYSQGLCYLGGIGVKKNLQAALRCFKVVLMVNSEDPRVCRAIRMCYENEMSNGYHGYQKRATQALIDLKRLYNNQITLAWMSAYPLED
jgi:TPR repeat protein